MLCSRLLFLRSSIPVRAIHRASPESDLWARADAYHNSFLLKADPVLDATQHHTRELGKNAATAAVSPAQGKFLHLLLRGLNAKRVLEVGSLGGYSAIWMARALPDDGELVALEISAVNAQAIEENPNNTNHFVEAKRLVRSGGIIIVDNTGRKGYPADPGRTGPGVEGVRALLSHIRDDDEVEAATIHTVGEKGFDGFTFAYRK
ncbi:S-adenosyl-L-methionine-dependent methyltransferase [Roridomyces roridus]|uniref:S-adenosyl-L-methionine-dependent methyltransferase n=1 Tax=Roridomyces roridus TaxID=1738132 RepID=A0AAD7B3P5_9AGAR|nr:S-adenosyl-L-methionine-dependent methyltransferase [Roridomyces roridus]